MFIPRIIELDKITDKKSLFLLGPRQTGKSSLIKKTYPDSPLYNLLDATIYRQFSADPSRLRKEILAMASQPDLVIIDEIQRIPELLNEVHLMIEDYGIKFLLTGSSARALRKKGVNLLAGRARSRRLHPFIYSELGDHFDLSRALTYGTLPYIYFSDSPQEDLSEYTGIYLKEEIAAEGLTRNIPAFSRFLEVAALSNGSMLNYSNIASDAEVKRSTVVDYFQLLRDTLLGDDLPAWQKTSKRKAIGTAKFYFFDQGIVNFLSKNNLIQSGSSLFGQAFENFIYHELKTFCDYNPLKSLYYWRSKSQYEVDFILEEKFAIEVKGKSTLNQQDFKGLKALREENLLEKYIIVSCVDRAYVEDGIKVYPWKDFLKNLWHGL
ncbi:MAG: ATP-binding protein [Oligoflexus sp.]